MRSNTPSTDDNAIEAGRVLRRRKGLVLHTGVSLGDGRVAHNTPERGEHISSLDEFRKDKTLRVGEACDEAKQRAEALDLEDLHRPYGLFTNNCEHTASRITTGEAASPQLRGAAATAIAGAGVALMLVLRRPMLAAAARLGSRLVKKFTATR